MECVAKYELCNIFIPQLHVTITDSQSRRAAKICRNGKTEEAPKSQKNKGN